MSAVSLQVDANFGENAGKQCVAMSLTAIIFSNISNVNIWDNLILNRILIVGNELYGIISRSINKDFLLLVDVPEIVELDNKTYHLQYSESYSGSLEMTSNNRPFVTLEHALNQVFSSSVLNFKTALLTIGSNTVAIFRPFPDIFKVFDSHSKDQYGMPYSFGSCVLTSIEGLQNLVAYFKQTSYCQAILPFELKGVGCTLQNEIQGEQSSKSTSNNSGDNLNLQKQNKASQKKLKRENESPQQRSERLAKQRAYAARKRANESVSERKNRLSKHRKHAANVRAVESPQDREKRLTKHREHEKQNRANESPQSREERLSVKRQLYKTYITQTTTISKLIEKFHSDVAVGPLYICSCCDQLWYKHSVSQAGRFRQQYPNMVIHLQHIFSVDNTEWLCHSCNRHLKKGKVPPCAISNGQKFHDKPEFWDLNELECRLVAPRLAFQKIMQAPRGKQFKITGNVVNVPADVINTVSMLPRLPQETATIKVQLKRRLQYKSSALSLNVRPNKVIQAAAWLANTSDLYREHGITFDKNWESNFNQTASGEDTLTTEPINDNNKSLSSDSADDEWSEDEAEIPAGVTDSMLTPTDFLNDGERQHIYNFAPGEGGKPLSLFRDRYSEELSYPGIFLGNKRPDDKQRLVSAYYSEICKSELRRSDRRAAMCIENIFFKAKKLQMKILLGKSQIALRKCKINDRSITAGQLKTPGTIENLIRFDEGYKFLRALRGSPPYFEKAKKDLFAMIRQLGPASLFCSFSSAETKWVHLLRILGKLVDHKDYTDDELEDLNWEEKCRLIQSDPVTCARHFDYQFNTFLREFLMSDSAPIGKIKDWFYRVEYQQRGSPHIHMLIWLEGAPVFGVDTDEDVVSFIDKIIICQKPQNDVSLLELVNRQTHRHSHTCRKKSKNTCRFNYPQPPMRATQILHPLDDTIPSNIAKNAHLLWKDIQKKLNDLKEGEDISFDQLLTNLDVSEQNYILAIRSSISTPTIFLKRNPSELRVNNYNPACLKAWRANMDIQFVLDVYACAMYIVSYISKAQKGMSELLRRACAEAREGNASIKQQVRDIGNKFLNSVEISAQEAVYLVLQIPMRKSSRQVVFINTSPPDDRVELLKPISEIEHMPDDSEEIHSGGLLKRYTERPASLQNVTLADWAAWYDCCGKQPNRQKSPKPDIDQLPLESLDNDTNDDDQICDDEPTTLNNNAKSTVKKRSQARIIRSVWFNKDIDPEKHYRELIMLFTPWRNEDRDLIKNFSSYKDHYMACCEQINEQMQQYAVCAEDLAEIQHNLQVNDDDEYDTIAPVTQHAELQDENEGNVDLHPDFSGRYDMSDDLGIPSAQQNNEPLVMNEIQDDEYRALVQKLNRKQKEFFDHALHLIKTSDKPFYAFLSGGAGVGKSHLIKAIYQAALKFYNSHAGEDFHQTKILLLAPTGKAAYIIKGNTIHSALAIPASQSLRNYKPLDSSRLNTLRCQLGGVKLILIDEISMVGNNMFTVQINNRLKDIKGSKEDFGGVSIIAIGDLFQLKPVMDGYIFKDIHSSDYSILVPNLWNMYFKMFELDEIMRQRDSKVFAEILNRLREGQHTDCDILKIKQRCVQNESECPQEAPRLFFQNALVDDYNSKAYESSHGNKYTIKAKDSVIGAHSTELRDKIMRQIPYVPLKNTKQLATKLRLAEGGRTELAMNIRTDDGMTNGASNIVKLVQLNQPDTPSGIIWVLFDQHDVGSKTRQENHQLYTRQAVQRTWTPIKPVTTQFAVGRTKSAQVVRKQFPLRPAAAKTVHRSQGDTQTKIVVNLNTKHAVSHIHYVALSRVNNGRFIHY